MLSHHERRLSVVIGTDHPLDIEFPAYFGIHLAILRCSERPSLRVYASSAAAMQRFWLSIAAAYHSGESAAAGPGIR